MEHANVRKFERIEHNLDVEWMRHRRWGMKKKAEDERILDLSTDGACIETCGRFEVGEPITVGFTLPSDMEQITMSGTVRWSHAQMPGTPGKPGVDKTKFGMEFIAATLRDQTRLRDYIEHRTAA